MKLGSWLIAKGKLSGAQLKRALLDQSFYGGHLSSSLMKLGYVDEDTLGTYLAETFQVPYASSAKFSAITPEVVRMIPPATAAKHRIVPLAVEGKRVHVAMMNPRDILIADEVAFLTGLQVDPWVSTESHLEDALEKFYQVPRSTRPSIPLTEEEGHDLLREDATPLPPAAAPPADSARAQVPAREELGLDGRPLSAPAESLSAIPAGRAQDRRESVPSQFPRSIAEWRDAGAAAGRSPDDPPAAAPAGDTLDAPVAAPPQPPRPSAPARPPLTLVPPPPPASLEEFTLRLKSSPTRDEVFEALVAFCAARFVRTALFVVMQEQVIGWGGRGEGIDPGRVRTTTVPFGVPSIFSYFRMGSDFYFGPVPDLPANERFYRDLSVPAPDRALLVPILIKGRLIALLYGDNGAGRREEPDIAHFRRVAQKASLALEILILRNKIEMI